MALKATVCKAALQIADIDRGIYFDRSLTLARHPSETDERMMMRLLAYALNVPADDAQGDLDSGKGMWDPDEPEWWQRDLTGNVVQWIEVGQPEEKRLAKACGRAGRVVVYAFGTAAAAWWQGLSPRLHSNPRLEAWRIEAEQSRALAALAARGMRLQLNRQDGVVWVGDSERGVEIAPQRLEAVDGAKR
ncbi:MAG: YaeQ family protein [Pseudomonadota bacterium]|nr:YaeQ family protein [Pseudomonadota bacterium]